MSHTKNEPEIGKLIEDNPKRDAIHIAVAPVIAAHRLTPGVKVGLNEFKQASSRSGNPIGVVDPYLSRPVEKGQKFWLFLFPKTITALNHVWEHPAFPDVETPAPEETEKQKSETWLRDFAETVEADYEDMMYTASTHCGEQRWGDYLCDGGKWEGQGTPKEFWKHYEIVTGKKPREDGYGSPGIFSCSC
jgi:hypothetical protein